MLTACIAFMIYWMVSILVWIQIYGTERYESFKKLDPIEKEEYYLYLASRGASNELIEDERKYSDRARSHLVIGVALDLFLAPATVPVDLAFLAFNKLRGER